MDCIECKATNPELNRYCGQCGAMLGCSLEETIQKKGLRNRHATENDIAESVVERLMKWAKWLGMATAVPVALFAILLGWSYVDIRSVVESGKTQIGIAVRDAKADIDTVRQTSSGLRDQVSQLQSDIDGYKRANGKIEKLQEQLFQVKGEIIDLGRRDLKVNSLTTTGPGAGYLSFLENGCPANNKRALVTYCAQGSPPSLFQVTSTGERRPVSSISPVGFQDSSISSKPTCSANNRGTFYVEKGSTRVTDKPFLCIKKSDDTYGWIQLGITP